MAAPAFRDKSGRNYTQSTSAPTSYPSTAATGDFLLLTLVTDPATVNTPTGWTLLTGFPISNVEGLPIAVNVYWRIKDAATAAPTITWSGNGNIFNKWDMVAYSGADQTTPLNVVSAVTNAQTASSSPSVASMTTTAADCTIFWWCSNNSGSGTNTTPPSGFTSRLTQQGGTGAGDRTQATAGATGAMTGSMTSDAYVAFAVAIQPPQADTVSAGGATAGGTAPTAKTSATASGAIGAGNAPAAAAAATAGGADAAGAGPAASVYVAAGGATAGGVAPTDNTTGGDTVSAGGATAGGTAPTAAATVTAGAATGAGAAPTVKVSLEAGGATAGGFEPSKPTSPRGTPRKLGFPLGFPLGFRARQSNRVTVTNAGSVGVPPILALAGKLVDPKVEITLPSGEQRALVMSGTIVDGDQLVLDATVSPPTVKLNSITNRREMLDTSRSRWFELPPGDSTLELTATSAGTSAGLTVSWRDAYQ